MFGIIYSQNTGRIRWHTDNGHSTNELDQIIRLGKGEVLFKAEDEHYGDILALQDLISKKSGLIPTNDRHAIVDKSGNVVGIILADPLCGDSIAGCDLIPHNQASPGWKFDKIQGFIAPIEISSDPITDIAN